jgi:precorrin-6B methylase 2
VAPSVKHLAVTATVLLGAAGLYAAPALVDSVAGAPDRQADVIFVPSPPHVVDAMLELAEVGPGDVLYDLGSGDGRIPIAATQQHDIRAVGIEINARRIRAARANASAAGVEDKISFRQGDLFEADFSEASVVTLFLLQSLNEKLKPRLLSELEPGSRVVSLAFTMGEDWPPDKAVRVGDSAVYLWTIPSRDQTRRAPNG